MRRHPAEGQDGDGAGGEVLGAARPGEELEHAEPEGNQSQGQAQQGDAVPCPPGDEAQFQGREKGVQRDDLDKGIPALSTFGWLVIRN